MDTGVLIALIGAGSGILGAGITAPIVAALVSRRQRNATVELTEEQAEQIRGQVWRQLNDDLRAEIIRLQGRITDLETRLATLDTALREKSAELAGVQAERDQLRAQLAAAQATIAAKEQEIGNLKTQLAGLHLRPAAA